MSYQLFIERSAQKELAKIASSEQDKIIAAIKKLCHEPRPVGCKKLSGREAWRMRIGNYRIIYEINDNEPVVLVITIRHRRDAYRSP